MTHIECENVVSQMEREDVLYRNKEGLFCILLCFAQVVVKVADRGVEGQGNLLIS